MLNMSNIVHFQLNILNITRNTMDKYFGCGHRHQ